MNEPQEKTEQNTDEDRIEGLRKLLEVGVLVCTGDQIMMKRLEGGQTFYEPVAIFVKRNDDPENTYLATPTGVTLFECNEFHKSALEKAKETFLENLDLMIKQKQPFID